MDGLFPEFIPFNELVNFSGFIFLIFRMGILDLPYRFICKDSVKYLVWCILTDQLTKRENDGTELKIPLDKYFHSLSDLRSDIAFFQSAFKNGCNHQSVFFSANWVGKSFIIIIIMA